MFLDICPITCRVSGIGALLPAGITGFRGHLTGSFGPQRCAETGSTGVNSASREMRRKMGIIVPIVLKGLDLGFCLTKD